MIGQNEETAKYVGVKITNDAEANLIEAEIQEKISALKHVMPSIDKCLKTQGRETKFYQVLPLAGLGNLRNVEQVIRQSDSQDFSEKVIFLLAREMLEALEAMHFSGYYHLDLKPENGVLDMNGHLFLIDFGCTKSGPEINFARAQGDREYFSPERTWALLGKNHQEALTCSGAKVDTWAVGQTLLELFKGKVWDFEELEELIAKHSSLTLAINFIESSLGRFPDFTHPESDSLPSFILHLLSFYSSQRPSAVEAQNHPWFQKMLMTVHEWETPNRTALVQAIQVLKRNKRQGLSPQDLPHPHFFHHVARGEIENTIKQTLLQSTTPFKQVVLCGEGGIGKTTLVSHLVYDQAIREHFGCILWFRRGDMLDDLHEQFRFLAMEWNLISERATREEVQKSLFKYLEEREQRGEKPWLIVFDNAPLQSKDLAPFLPSKGGTVLITTRGEWGGKHGFSLPRFSEEQSVRYLSSLLQGKFTGHKRLCATLENLPIALHAAGSYISYEQLSEDVFFDQLEAIRKKDPLSTPLFSLWELIIGRVQERAAGAIATLDRLSFLGPDKVPPLFYSKEDTLPLVRYGLVSQEPGGISTHRLLQEKRRLMLTDESKRALVAELLDIFQKEVVKPAQKALLFPHLQSLLQNTIPITGFPLTTRISIKQMQRWVNSVQRGELQLFILGDLVEKTNVLIQEKSENQSALASLFTKRINFLLVELNDPKKAFETLKEMLDVLCLPTGILSEEAQDLLEECLLIVYTQTSHREALKNYLKEMISANRSLMNVSLGALYLRVDFMYTNTPPNIGESFSEKEVNSLRGRINTWEKERGETQSVSPLERSKRRFEKLNRQAKRLFTIEPLDSEEIASNYRERIFLVVNQLKDPERAFEMVKEMLKLLVDGKILSNSLILLYIEEILVELYYLDFVQFCD